MATQESTRTSNTKARIAMSSLSKETLELIADWAEVLTVVLALASAFCGIVLVIANKPLRKIEARENLTLQGDVAKAQADAAKAQRELLEERQHSANRDISVEDQQALAKKLITFRRQRARIAAFPVNFETRTAAMSLFGILINAKWDVEAPKMLCCAPDFMVQGVYVTSTADEPSCRAAAALNDLLKTTPFAGVFMPSCSGSNNRLAPKGPPLHVYILVGDKPTPLRSRVK